MTEDKTGKIKRLEEQILKEETHYQACGKGHRKGFGYKACQPMGFSPDQVIRVWKE